MNSIHLLYIEDDPEIGKWVNETLQDRGYRVTWLTSGEHALEHADSCRLAILDVMLPGLDGFTVGQRLKKQHPNLPILMLSARTSIDDKLQGLEFADDYLTKPFHPDELAARIEVLLRRSGHASRNRSDCGICSSMNARTSLSTRIPEKRFCLQGSSSISSITCCATSVKS